LGEAEAETGCDGCDDAIRECVRPNATPVPSECPQTNTWKPIQKVCACMGVCVCVCVCV
jgi:hypothetical protein